MFRFTSKKVEDEKFKKLYEQAGEQNALKSILQYQKQKQSPHQQLNRSALYSKKETTIFDNFAIEKQQTRPTSNQHKKQQQCGTYNFPRSTAQKSYYIIPSSKSGLMDLYEKYKAYEPQEDTSFHSKQKVSTQRRIRPLRSLSHHVNSSVDGEEKGMNLNDEESIRQLYFESSLINNDQDSNQEEKFQSDLPQNKYKQTHKSCFRGACRQKLTEQTLFPNQSQIPGPGQYENKSQFESLKRYQKAKGKEQEKKGNVPLNEVKNKLSAAITKHFTDEEINSVLKKGEKNEIIQLSSINKKNNLPSFMFVEDQRDRFGENQYINFFSNKNPLYCPGPGQYQQSYLTIGQKQEQIEKAKDQRKLLKEWLNPKKAFQTQQLGQDGIQNEQNDQEPIGIYSFSYN